MFASLFILLYIGHLLADYLFQTDVQAKCKAGWTEGRRTRTRVATTTDGLRI